eukprot:symbB.v1.2.012411.t1/scaffold831.1/size159220/7
MAPGTWATPEAAKWLEHRKALSRHEMDAHANRQVKSVLESPKAKELRETKEEASAHAEALQRRRLATNFGRHGASHRAENARFRRPHVLHVDVGELALHATLLNLKLAWYETVRYFVSFHPSSVKLPALPFPEKTPRPSASDSRAKYMASALAPAKQTSEAMVYDFQESVHFDEHLEMHRDHLDSHFIRCSKSSMLSESTVLLGYRPLPLREPELYARWATWDVLDLSTGEELAQLSLRINVVAPPNQIRLPHLSEVSDTGFTLNWSEPLGSSATAYTVSLKPSDGAAALSRQFTTGHSAGLSGLQPNATYVVDVRGMNEAGWGDSCKLEASTAPPRKAVERDGNVTTL